MDSRRMMVWVGRRMRDVRLLQGGSRMWLRNLPLLPSVLFAVSGGIAIVLLAKFGLDWLLHPSQKAADPIDVTKLSLTVAGGVGAAVALVVAYRRQRDVEQGRFVERFGAAAAQLGDRDVAVRIAGVYAMAGVADESGGLRRQQCIDVLCGYLRLPYSPESGANHQSKLVLTQPRTGEDGTPLGEQERTLEYRQNDRAVRMTIMSVIGDRLRDHEYRWSACGFDFQNAYLEEASLYDAVFAGNANFNGATFSGLTTFARATFSQLALFSDAKFLGAANFEKATFSDLTSFSDTQFRGRTDFKQATFRQITFFDSTFDGSASFDEAMFAGRTMFEKAKFSSPVTFKKATFSGVTSFDYPRQWGPPAPKFDWDDDVSMKPDRVTPRRRWPPEPQASEEM